MKWAWRDRIWCERVDLPEPEMPERRRIIGGVWGVRRGRREPGMEESRGFDMMGYAGAWGGWWGVVRWRGLMDDISIEGVGGGES